MWMRRERWIVVILVLVTLAVYWPVGRCGFINFDDDRYVTENSHVQAGLTGEGVRWALTSGEAANWHPLTWMSHMLDCQFYGLRPEGHHFTNLVFHIINALLVFVLLRSLTGAVWRSAMVAALFAWHPMHVESVAWVSERKDVLSTFFGLLSLWAYANYARISNGPGKKHRAGIWYAFALGLFVLGLMSKPMLVTLPLVMLLLDYWPLRRSSVSGSGKTTPSGGLPLKKLLAEKIPFLLLAGGSSVVTFLVQQRGGAVAALGRVPWQMRLGNVPVAYLRYVEKLFWPRGLCILYPLTSPWPAGLVAAAAAGLVAGTIAVCMVARSRPYLPVGWFWFIGMLIPVIGLVQVGRQALADRYTYVPYLGLFIMLVWGVAELSAGWAGRKAVLPGLCAAVLAGCLWLTHDQLRYWKDSVSVFERAIEVNPTNTVALSNAALALMADGKVEEGIAKARQALKLEPNLAEAEATLAYGFICQGKVSEAIPHYRAALRLAPDLPDALSNLAETLSAAPNPEERNGVEAVKLAERACQLTGYSRPLFVSTLADAYAEAGRFDEAIATADKARDLARRIGNNVLANMTEQRLELYRAHRSFHGQTNPADQECETAMQLAGKGDVPGAIDHYREALRLDPNQIGALNNLAWLLATDSNPKNRDGQEAVRLATHACELTHYEQPLLIGTLAAAQAEAGQFEQAVTSASKARELFLAAGNTALAETNRKLIELYRSHQAYRAAAN